MFYKIKLCKKIGIVLILTISLMNCASKSSPQELEASNNTNNDITATTNLGLQIEHISEGMLLTFSDIPQNVTTMLINIYEEKYATTQSPDMLGIVLGPKLDEIKQTKKLIIPFAQQDTEYAISVNLIRNDETDPATNLIESVQAENGTYIINNMELILNDEQTGVILSAEPEFSSSVEYDSYKYEYILLNLIDENKSLSNSIYSGNELSCNFIPDTINLIKESDPSLNGTFPSYVVALCNIDYQGVSWKVCVAKSEKFSLSL